ncbi:hypothetical protein Mic7113_0908 [Allocoleopsis franciscana PCC 7113]|uniref:Uncharacterized protein n=1 Tax=Allocoleopsis franciscana PCC 7113 TaxID=1173027 RepID=K9W995_9CYAN|nr:hypothetical protein Mic7113_0908 [Allocoleopsis franciscana PCC 7113]
MQQTLAKAVPTSTVSLVKLFFLKRQAVIAYLRVNRAVTVKGTFLLPGQVNLSKSKQQLV